MLCKISAEVVQLIFNILGWIMFLVVAFLRSIFWISFSMSNFDIGWNEKTFWFSNLLFISRMLGWNMYLQIALSTGFERFWFIIHKFSFIFKFEIAFLKKLFNSSAILRSSCNNPLSSTSLIFEPIGFRLLKNFFLSSLYSRLQNIFYFFKAFNEFSARFLKWIFAR